MVLDQTPKDEMGLDYIQIGLAIRTSIMDDTKNQYTPSRN
jgi:hypothetical protein